MSLDIRFCPLLYGILLGLHGLAGLACLLFMPGPIFFCLLLLVLIVRSVFHVHRHHASGGNQRVVACQLGSREALLVLPRERRRCELPETIFWSELVLVLRFKPLALNRRSRWQPASWLILLPGALSEADHSRLRCYLCFQA